MNAVEAALRQTLIDLDATRNRWALVGGLAVSARAEPRFTRDVDVALAVADDEGAERVVRDLIRTGYRLLASVEQDAVGRLATVRLAPGEQDGVVLDVLFASSGIEVEIVEQSERIEILPGLTVPVASTGHLMAVKLLARDDVDRPQDLADLRSLAEVATEHDFSAARDAVLLIGARGFHRGRDLVTALAELRGG